MDANKIWVQPDDSIQHLQSRMTDSGWGQIPVIDPVSGAVIGIVTRTDLLKTLSPKASKNNRENLETQLTKALPLNRLAIIRTIAAEAVQQKLPIYVVGGFVRDLMLDRPSIDFDIVVEGDAILMAKIVAAKHGGRVTVHTRFGTAKWYLDQSEFQGEDVPEFLDFITARLEFYAHPTALPTVERSSIKFDLHRRDFTINTLALRLDGRYFGELYDFWGGLSDIRDHLIRVLHSLSFVDDPTRMLRAIRFEQRFGFRIEDRTLQLMLDAKGLLGNLSGDRIRHEIDLILDEGNFLQIISRLAELGLLNAIHTSLPWNQTINSEISVNIGKIPPKTWSAATKGQIVYDNKTMVYLLWLSQVPVGDVISVCKRLKLSEFIKKNIQAIKHIITIMPGLEDSLPSKVYQELEDMPIMAIFIAFLKVDSRAAEILDKYVVTWKKITPRTTGNELKKLGLPPSQVYQKILQQLRAAWLDGEINSPEEEAVLLEEIVKNEQQSPGSR